MDFDTWAQLGNRGWGYADVFPYFKRMERRISEGRRTRPSAAATARSPSPTSTGCIRCARRSSRRREHRYPAQPRLQRHHPGRHRLRPAHHPKGRRVSAATAFLHPARKRVNVTVRTGAHATECCRGPARRRRRLQHRRPRRRAHDRAAGREVILGRHLQFSAAAAAVRHRPARLLQEHGIAVRHALAGVGENLRDHYAPRFTGRVKNIDTINERARGLQPRGQSSALGDHAQRHPRPRPHARVLLLALRTHGRHSDLPLTFTPAATRRACRGDWTTSPA